MATVQSEDTKPWPSVGFEHVLYTCCCGICAHADASEAVKSGSWMRYCCLEILVNQVTGVAWGSGLLFFLCTYLLIAYTDTYIGAYALAFIKAHALAFIIDVIVALVLLSALIHIRFMNRKALAQRMGFAGGSFSRTFCRYCLCTTLCWCCCFPCVVDAQETVAVRSSLRYNLVNFCDRLTQCLWFAMLGMMVRVAWLCDGFLCRVASRLFDRLLCINMDIPVAVIDWAAHPRPVLPRSTPVVLSSKLRRPTADAQSVNLVGNEKIFVDSAVVRD